MPKPPNTPDGTADNARAAHSGDLGELQEYFDGLGPGAPVPKGHPSHEEFTREELDHREEFTEADDEAAKAAILNLRKLLGMPRQTPPNDAGGANEKDDP